MAIVPVTGDPRYNAPPRLSDLHGEERRVALLARDQGHREAYMRLYIDPPEQVTFVRRALRAVFG